MSDNSPNDSTPAPLRRWIRALSVGTSSRAERDGAVAGLCALGTAALPPVVQAYAGLKLSRIPAGLHADLGRVAHHLCRLDAEESAARRQEEAMWLEAARRALPVLLSRDAGADALRDASTYWGTILGGFPALVAREIEDALDSTWRVVATPADVDRRRELGEVLRGVTRRPIDLSLPAIGLPVARVGAEGHPGRLRPTYGLDLYDLHLEWPVDGMGVRKDQILVLTEEGPMPVFDWLRESNVRVLCPRCGGFLDRAVEFGCPARPRARP